MGTVWVCHVQVTPSAAGGATVRLTTRRSAPVSSYQRLTTRSGRPFGRTPRKSVTWPSRLRSKVPNARGRESGSETRSTTPAAGGRSVK